MRRRMPDLARARLDRLRARRAANGDALADFTTDRRVVLLTAMAVPVGLIGACVAYALIKLIGLCTNLAFFQRFSFSFAAPHDAHLGPLTVLVPVAGGLVIGLMARFGSEKIRGHGIPEALEAIVIGESKIEPKVAVLKPLSSAISIGTGGPFGAEGPIIMTGGAFGSLFGQLFHLSSAERKALLVAGAAAAMSATFSAPLAAVLIAVELLLFEWKPRSFVPVAVASAVAGALRVHLLGPGPIFPTPDRALPSVDLPWCVAVGLVAGVASGILTGLVYGFEDLFRKLPTHCMWWPAIGGLVVGVGGLIQPRALGVGYDTIHALLNGRLVVSAILALVVVKVVIWSFALGSGTSGGVLAPLLIMGGALGALEGHVLPGGTGLWAMISMSAILGGTMRSPLTAVVFTLELTHDVNALLPLLLACTTAHALTVLTLKRSILTEKLARRGHHITREYSVDPLELMPVREVMTEAVESLPASSPVSEVVSFFGASWREVGERKHQAYPVVDEQGAAVGLVTRHDALEWEVDGFPSGGTLGDMLTGDPIVASPDEMVRRAADRMAQHGLERVPVVGPDGTLVGILSVGDVLAARLRTLSQERTRRRLIAPPALRPMRTSVPVGAADDGDTDRAGAT